MAAGAEPFELILASGSPRRRELLERVGLSFRVVAADIDESVIAGEAPLDYAARLASEKADAVAAAHPGCAILAADTIVVAAGQVLGKPATADEARGMLGALLGGEHHVTTAMCARSPAGREVAAITTAVVMREASAAEIDGYIASGEWRGKAGGYAIQGIAAALVTSVRGSVTNVIGLPLAEALALVLAVGAGPADFASGAPA